MGVSSLALFLEYDIHICLSRMHSSRYIMKSRWIEKGICSCIWAAMAYERRAEIYQFNVNIRYNPSCMR